MNIDTVLSDALDRVVDPISGKGLLSGGRASPPRISEGAVSVVVDVTGLSTGARETIEAQVKASLMSVAGVDSVRVALTAEKRGRKIIAIGSGKGGVGKSTLSANLAVALRKAGRKVGLVDADIYGPSQARLMGTEGIRPTAEGQKMDPVLSPHGVPMLSMAQLVKPGQAIAWRGPMAANALGQLIDAEWGDTELLLLDLPPGTGDVQLTMVQKYKPVGALIVSTPQDLALMDATRAIDFFNQAHVPIIGLVENMAGYECPHCGEVSDPFGHGGAQAAAMSMELPFLGRVPLDIGIRTASDAGTPPALADDDAIFAPIAQKLSDWLNPAKPASF
ncbi:Mrp/NBP35 family ATP-binding protein [Sphingomonas montanisoli]|uniref:Iron-sulfur cluster carrier protein n=1 Tax=Sphingomonas montanisoli TaxID=2606412 RepID=A0A5D9C168_9SPHN|nr:Mrp/NBP35 family ATP-binding protein [Sphingomonas montanisoli]TZG24937.1 Mrp/NBP35 family ATP-binding protein [Sphingomonas montanisoli]